MLSVAALVSLVWCWWMLPWRCKNKIIEYCMWNTDKMSKMQFYLSHEHGEQQGWNVLASIECWLQVNDSKCKFYLHMFFDKYEQYTLPHTFGYIITNPYHSRIKCSSHDYVVYSPNVFFYSIVNNVFQGGKQKFNNVACCVIWWIAAVILLENVIVTTYTVLYIILWLKVPPISPEQHR